VTRRKKAEPQPEYDVQHTKFTVPLDDGLWYGFLIESRVFKPHAWKALFRHEEDRDRCIARCMRESPLSVQLNYHLASLDEFCVGPPTRGATLGIVIRTFTAVDPGFKHVSPDCHHVRFTDVLLQGDD
jgi:hypothetical protein